MNKKMKWKTFFVKIWRKKEIVLVYLSQIMPSCVNLNFSSPKIWAKNEPRSWVNWKKDHSRSCLPISGDIVRKLRNRTKTRSWIIWSPLTKQCDQFTTWNPFEHRRTSTTFSSNSISDGHSKFSLAGLWQKS